MSWIETLLRDGGTIDINVDYYSDAHKTLLESLPPPYSDRVKSVAGRTIQIPAIEFITYCLFGYKNSNIPELSDYRRLRDRLGRHLGTLEVALERSPTSLRTLLSGKKQIKGVSEDVGIGVSLTVVSSMLGLSEADWDPIPTTNNEKSLDYFIASDGARFIEVESKGSSVDHPSHKKTDPIYDHAASIGEKKEAQWKLTKATQALYFGTIGVIDTTPKGVMQCWLLDPEGSFYNRRPSDQQVINHLQFAARLLREVMPYSRILAALEYRLVQLLEADNMAAFENKPLVPWEPRRWQDFAFRHISDPRHEYAGRVFELPDGRMFFYGFHFKLLQIIHRQNFQAIRNLDFPAIPQSTLLTGELGAIESLSPRAENSYQFPELAADFSDEPPPRFEKRGNLHVTSSGRVFGMIESLS